MTESNWLLLILKRIGAAFAGILTIIILSIVTDMLMQVVGVFSASGRPIHDSLFLLPTIYRCAYAVLGSFIAAQLAPDRPMTHALALGVIGLAALLIGAVLTWNKGPELGPKWYSFALIATAIPCAWAGGKLHGDATGRAH